MVEVAVLEEDHTAYMPLLAEAGIEAEGFADPDDLVAAGPDIVVVLGSPGLAARVADRLPALEWIQSTWAGVDELAAVGFPVGVVVTGLPGVFGRQMREFVFGHLLAHTQRVVERSAARRWDPSPPPLLAGSRIGVLGTGSIGTSIAETAAHLGMAVRGCSRTGAPKPPFGEMYSVSELGEFADGVDHLVVVLPATDATSNLVDATVLDRLAAGATLVNVGRGNTVDLDAVVDSLRSGRLSLAVLDVLPLEPLPEGDPLWDVDGLVVTSHTAAWSRPEAVVDVFLSNLDARRRGLPMRGVIDLRRGY